MDSPTRRVQELDAFVRYHFYYYIQLTIIENEFSTIYQRTSFVISVPQLSLTHIDSMGPILNS